MSAVAAAQTVNYGETGAVSSTVFSDRNSNRGIYLEVTTGTAAPYAVNSCSFYAYQQGEGYVECGIYTDNGGKPGSMVCHGSYTEVYNGSSGVVTVPLSGCGTLSANTNYWVFTNTTDNGFYLGVSANCNASCAGTYPSQNTPDWNSSSAVPYGTYPANPAVTENDVRASQYITVTPGSSAQVAAPQSSPAAGSYTSAQTVTLSNLTPGATICYTTDGSDPTATTAGTCSHGTAYSGGLTMSSTTTVKAIGTEAGSTNSTELTSLYTITPIAFVQDKECTSSTGTSVTCAFSSPVAAGDALMIVVSPVVSTTATSYAISVSDNLNGAWTQNGGTCFYGYGAEAATFYYLNSKAGSITVTVTSSTSTSIYSSIAEYSGIATSNAVDVPASCALTTAGATVDAPNVTTTYANDLILASPAIAGNGGFTSVGSPYTLRSWKNGAMSLADDFVTSTGVYSGAVFTLQYGQDYVYGITATYKATGAPPQIAAPAASPVGGSYTSAQTVTLSDATTGATICYTTDGTDPTAATAGTCSHGIAYSGGFAVSSTTTVKAIGTEAGYANSAELSSTYTIEGTSAVSEPTITPSGGSYSSAQTITLNDQTSGAIVCYTTDGSDPEATAAGTCSHGTTYNGGFTVTSTTTVKAIGTESGYANSTELSSTYTIEPTTVAQPVSTPSGGSFSSAQTISLSDQTPGAAICYTTDGSDPTATTAGTCSNGSTYSGAFTVSSTTTVKAIGTEAGYANSAELSSSYTIGAIAFVQSNQCESTGTSITCAFPSTVSAGDALMVFVAPENTTGGLYTLSASDNLNGAWTQNGSTCFSPWNGEAATFYYLNSQAGDVTVSITSSTSTAIYATIAEYSGIATSNAVDVPASCATFTSSQNVVAPNVTTTTAKDLIVASPVDASNGGTVSVGSPYSMRASAGARIPLADQFASSTGTYTGAAFAFEYEPAAFGMTATYMAIGSVPQVIVSVSPTSSILAAGQTEQFSASVAHTGNTAVTWTISPAGSGTVSGLGLYTAPTTISETQTVTVTATSQADSTKSASATVTLTTMTAVAVPTSTPSGRSYTAPQYVTLSDQTSGATICYTTDGSDPEASSAGTCSHGTTYTGGFGVEGNTTLKAIGTEAGYANSEEMLSVYTFGPITYIQGQDCQSSGTSVTCAYSSSVAAGDALMVMISPENAGGSADTFSVSDNLNGAWAQNGNTCFSANTSEAAMFYYLNSKAGSVTVTVTSSRNATVETSIVEYSGIATSNAVDVPATCAPATGNTITAPSVTTTNADDLILAGVSMQINGDDLSVSFPYSLLESTLCDAPLADQPVSSVGTYAGAVFTLDYGGSSTYGITTAFKAAETGTITVGLTPSTAVLYGGQNQQFTASVTNTSNAGVTWTISPLVGAVDGTGLYTAPSAIMSQQTVTVTATSQADSTKSASATITLMPPISVSVTPPSATLYGGQAQQFSATVINTNNTGVIWSISPAGTGAIDASGNYTAPASIATQQTVTVTATSQADGTTSASATITLSPPPCSTNGYSFERTIVIDHTKVPNTDQVNFPFLFNTTDPLFATTTNGGHVTSPNGYDIIFSTDPNGLTKLDHELEEYNPVTGQVIAWVRIPTLSHTSDTVLYVFYGNSGVTSSQQNTTGVWDSNFAGVWHLPNGTTLSPNDSTANANNGTLVGDPGAVSGVIGGAAAFNGSNQAINVGNNASLNTSAFTVSAWIYPTNGSSRNGIFSTRNTNAAGSWQLEEGNSDGYSNSISVTGVGTYMAVTTANSIDLNAWNYVVAEGNGSSAPSIYVNGVLQALTASSNYIVANNTANKYIGEGTTNSQFFPGNIDEVRLSNVARPSGWIATEYNNQSSPTTFYSVSSENTVTISPGAVSLNASQSQQFSAVPVGSCADPVIWSIAPAGIGALTSNGLYTAPASITARQTLTITATDQITSTQSGTATVTLLPPPPTLVLRPAVQPPYASGSSEGFVATLDSPTGAPESGAVVAFSVSGVNVNDGSSTADSNGIASYSYIGSNAGTDIIQASAVVNGVEVFSNQLSVSWSGTASANSEGTITLQSQHLLGLTALCGAFTDSNGTVIEPLSIGAEPKVFVVPAGATQLQLGVVDDRYGDNTGSFLVEVNGTLIAVKGTTMPWIWVTSGQNYTYRFGIQDGANPIIAAASLVPGSEISVAYQSGTVSAGFGWPQINGDGDQAEITGMTTGSTGTYFPTLYMTASSYPIGQPISFSAIVKNGSGSPLPGVPVILEVNGANARELQATTSSSGIASFNYAGLVAGVDTLQAEALPSGNTTLVSNQASVTWSNFTSLPPTGSLSLTPTTVQPLPASGQQSFTVYATDASGAPVPNLSVELVVSGVDDFNMTSTTDTTGHVSFVYQDVNPGTASVVATALIDNMAVSSNVVSVPWTLPASSTTASNGSGNAIGISISAPSTVTLPNSLQLTGTVIDSNPPAGSTVAVTWSQVSGPGAVSFGNPQQATTTASFSQQGNYVIELSATDTVNSGSLQFSVTVKPVPGTTQGWIGSPTYGATVTGIVPIMVASGVTLQSGTLTYYPANNLNNVVTLNANTSGSGQIGTFDTTLLPNGSYWIQLQATDSNGNVEYSLALVIVAGNYKPGRVTATVTDLVVPATGLAINIQRTYDSLNANTVGDFGYGWTLGTNVNLVVDPKGDVTFTLGGQRKTFYFAPQPMGFPFAFYVPSFKPEPGLFGTLTDSAPGCVSLFDFLVPDGSSWDCVGGGQYNPAGYVYTDPSGTSYLISSSGALQLIVDRNGNALTIGPSGIFSSTGLNVPFLRDSQGRITQIKDPQGNKYLYSYDENGNLSTVTYPVTTCQGGGGSQPISYTYAANHYYTGGTDACNNALPSTSYYGPSDTDANGLPLNGRLKSVEDAMQEVTSYTYDLDANTTTITNPAEISVPPDSGTIGTTIIKYDSYGMLLKSTDPLGNLTQNTYDANHNLTSVTDPLLNVTTYTYDSNGNQTSVTYPSTGTSTNTKSSTAYNQFSEPLSTTDELGNVRTFNYDTNYNPSSVTDSLGTLASFIFNSNGTLEAGAIGYDITSNPTKGSQFAYDANSNLVGRTDALGRTTSYAYNLLGQKTSMTIPVPSGASASAATTTYTYDPLGNLTQTSAPLGRTTSSTYDANGNKLTDTDALGHVTRYQYDALNRLWVTTYPDSTTDTRTYDFRNNLVDEVDQLGHDTHYEYDLAGRLVSVIKANGTLNATTFYTYDNDGRKLGEIDPDGHTTSYGYDAAGNLTSVSGANGNFQYTYDNARNRISMEDGDNNLTKYQYDARKRLVQTTYPDTGTGPTTTINTYDGPGNRTKVTDQAGNVVQYNYDAANQLTSVVQLSSPNTGNQTTTYGYDPNGNLTSLTDANLNTTHNSYDLLYELTTRTLPDGANTETRTYDTAGNLISLKHFNGDTTTYGYDPLNRLSSRTPDPSTGETAVSFSYTLTGKRHTMTDASGTTTYTYDALDRLTTKATPEGTLNYTYDAASNLASMTSGDGNVSVSYTWNSLNQLSTVVDSHLGTTTYTYDTANNLTTVQYPNGVQATLQYDALNRLNYLSSLTTPSTGYMYTFGNAGNRISATELNGRSINWSYDGIYRLTNESISNAPSKVNGSVAYGLDPVGNRLSATSTISGINSGAYSFNPDDQELIESYDADGNTTATGGKSFAYDSEDRLKSMNGGAVTIVYDGDGNRVAKTVNGVTTRYLVDDLNPTGYAQVVEETGGTQRVYTYGLQRIGEYQVINSTWTPSFYGYDGLGNVRYLSNSSGAVTDTNEYDAFGNLVNFTGTTPNVYLYRGEQYDSDLGMYYMRARYYNPVTGRFMSRDSSDGSPDNPNTLHKYLYAGGDPINASDPSGRSTVIETTDIIKLGALAVATGAAITNYQQHADQTEGALRQLGASLSCGFTELGTKAFAWVQFGLAGDTGIVYRSGSCTVSYKPRVKKIKKDPNDCNQQWIDAYAYCSELGSSPDRYGNGRHVWGGDFMACVRGQVPQRCGGNKVE